MPALAGQPCCIHLVLQAAVLALCVFPHDEDVHILVPSHHPWQALAVDDIGIEVQAGAGEGQRKKPLDSTDKLVKATASSIATLGLEGASSRAWLSPEDVVSGFMGWRKVMVCFNVACRTKTEQAG